MTDLQPRKVPILTGINDIPSNVGQSNHPNASLLCANYNALIDDVETNLNTVQQNLLNLEQEVLNLGSPSTTPTATNTVTYNGGLPLSSVVVVPITYSFGSWGNGTAGVSVEILTPSQALTGLMVDYQLTNAVSGEVTITNGIVSINAIDNEGSITVDVNLLSLPTDLTLVIPYYFEVVTNTKNYPITVLFLNTTRVADGNYGWDNTFDYGASGGGGS